MGYDVKEEFKKDMLIKSIGAIVEIKTGADVEVRKTLKNNGKVLTGLNISEKGSKNGVVAYIEDTAIKKIQEGDMSAVEAADEVVKQYKLSREGLDNTVACLQNVDKEYILSRVEYKLVNKEMNEQMLHDVPHRSFLDLAVVYAVIIARGGENGSMIYVVRNDTLNAFGITQEELEDAAAKNTLNAGFVVKGINNVIEELSGKKPTEDEIANTMLIVTNRWFINGATALLFTQLFEPIADEYEADVIIIPSSIHEVIALPAIGGAKKKHSIKEMICQVNSTLEQEDVLSDSVYLYCRGEKQVKCLG